MQYWKCFGLLAGGVLLAACSNEAPTLSAQIDGNTDAVASAGVDTADVAVTGRVFIVSPADGATVTSPVTVQFGIEGYSVAPAGTYEPLTGHHHLLINTALPPLDMPIPADANHVHFGAGQTETTVELAAGQHTLQLLLGDGNHIPHQPPLASDIITVTVSE